MRQSLGCSHLLFADDMLIFCGANSAQADVLKQILHIYEQASWQMVNFTKIDVMFSKGFQLNAEIISHSN